MAAPDDPHSDSRFRRSESVAHRRIEDEVLLIPIRSDPKQGLSVYSLNPTASLLWDLLDGSRTVQQLVTTLCERFEVGPEQARRDVETFCNDLLDCGAIEAMPADRPVSP